MMIHLRLLTAANIYARLGPNIAQGSVTEMQDNHPIYMSQSGVAGCVDARFSKESKSKKPDHWPG